MKISVTNEHFNQNWFLFREGKVRDGLLNLMNESMIVYPYSEQQESGRDIEDEEILPAILDKHLDVLGDPYAWCEKPRIRFSVRGINLGKGEFKNNHSYFDGRYPDDCFFNAEIYLAELSEFIIRLSGITVEELVIFARYRWCSDMNLNYLFADEAKEIEQKLLLGKQVLEDGFEIEEDVYSKMLKHLKSMPYLEYLKTDHWRHFRSESIKFYQQKCQLCGKKEEKISNLHLHHNSYVNRGRETFNDVVLLCNTCHKKHHNK
ncbi:HNH endonuclease signature motif containing protein [Paenibacillus oryzisoli]|uniref:HNH endonuclease signature motif containing protein n=1 Tax=Paenibacillus oryzisoli TaxID=1850517 RepID=UPI003D2976E7